MGANAKQPLITAPCCLCFLVFSLCVHLAAEQAKETPVTDGNGKVSANAMLAPVVVRDSQGLAAGNLRKEKLQVFDQDKLQIISGFIVQKRVRVESRPKAGALAQGVPSLAAPGVGVRSLSEIVGRMGTLEGQRSLVLISPGFLTLTPGAMAKKSFSRGEESYERERNLAFGQRARYCSV